MAVGLPLVSVNVVFLRLGGLGQFEHGAREMTLEVLCAAGPYLAVGRMQSAVAGRLPRSAVVERLVTKQHTRVLGAIEKA